MHATTRQAALSAAAPTRCRAAPCRRLAALGRCGRRLVRDAGYPACVRLGDRLHSRTRFLGLEETLGAKLVFCWQESESLALIAHVQRFSDAGIMNKMEPPRRMITNKVVFAWAWRRPGSRRQPAGQLSLVCYVYNVNLLLCCSVVIGLFIVSLLLFIACCLAASRAT